MDSLSLLMGTIVKTALKDALFPNEARPVPPEMAEKLKAITLKSLRDMLKEMWLRINESNAGIKR